MSAIVHHQRHGQSLRVHTSTGPLIAIQGPDLLFESWPALRWHGMGVPFDVGI